MVPEGILASVTSVETIYLLRYICVGFLGGYLVAVPAQTDLLISIPMHLIFGFVSFILSKLCNLVGTIKSINSFAFYSK